MDFGKALKLLSILILNCVSNTVFAEIEPRISTNTSKMSFHINALFLQPSSNNLKYAVFVSGNQPFSQSWHNQSITTDYSPGFELGGMYDFSQSPYNLSIDWLYLNTNDSGSKQASENTDPTTVEFVAPPYDVGPAVFGIKRADSTVNFNFNSIGFNIGRTFEYSSNVKARIFGGINVLRINQALTTTFSDYAGSPQILSQAYPLPADPNFYFKTKNTSQYLGAGPDVGINVRYQANNGFGLVGQFTGILTAGSMSVKDKFTSASSRLMALGITTSHQELTAPSMTQVVPGLDSKLGLIYNHSWFNCYNFTMELGYRFAYFINAISEVNPDTLVQAKLDVLQPEFATGTMAINSTDSRYSAFSVNGPYLDFTLTLA